MTRVRAASVNYVAQPPQSTFYYRCAGSGAPGLSHLTFGVGPEAMANFLSAEITGVNANPTIEVGKDPTTSVTGIKFDDGAPETADWEYAMTFTGVFAEGPINIAAKGSTMFSVTTLDGPIEFGHIPAGGTPAAPTDVCGYAPRVAVDESRVVVFGGVEIATLDFADPNGRHVGCQSQRLELPDGWQLAPNLPFFRAALGANRWSTDCVVLADGTAFTPISLEPCGTGKLDYGPETAACPNASWGVTDCSMRIAITRPNTLVDTFITNGGFEITNVNGGNVATDSWANIRAGQTGIPFPGVQTLQARTGTRSVCFDTTAGLPPTEDEAFISGWAQSSGSLAADSPLQEGFRVGAWAIVDEAITAQPGYPFDADGRDFSVLVDVYYTDATADYGIFAGFDPANLGQWQEAAVDIFPRKRMSHFIVHVLLYRAFGKVCFDDVGAGPITAQLVPNAGFEVNGTADGSEVPAGWDIVTSHEGPSAVPAHMATPLTGTGQVCFDSDDKNTEYGIGRIIKLHDVNARVLYLSGWSQAQNVTGGRSGQYSVYLDLQYDNGGWLYGEYAAFSTDDHGWEFRSTAIYPRAPVRYAYVYVLFRGKKGQVCFDDITLAYGPGRGSTPRLTCSAYGDPHIRTWDEYDYDLQSVGEYTLTDDGQLEVQIRAEAPSNVDPHATVVTGTSMFYGNSTHFINIAVMARTEKNASLTQGNLENPFVLVLDNATANAGHAIVSEIVDETDGLVLTDSAGDPVVRWRRTLCSCRAKWWDTFTFLENDQRVAISTFRSKFGRQYQNVIVSQRATNPTPTVGLCGNRNLDNTDDFMLRGSNTAIPQPLTPVQMYDQFGESWRLDNTTTNFYYLDGEGPETYHNRSWDDFYTNPPQSDFRASRRQPGTYTDAERNAAREACSTGIAPSLYNSCYFDVLFSGDVTFAEIYGDLDHDLTVTNRTSIIGNHSTVDPTIIPETTPPSSVDIDVSAAPATAAPALLAAVAGIASLLL